MRSRLALLALVFAIACSGEAEPRDQWRIVVSTDAPVPAFADRLLLEVLDARGAVACGGCSRLFGVDAQTTWPVSFGVVRPAGDGPFAVRGRLFRSDHVGPDGRPLGTMLLDMMGRLTEGPGIKESALLLAMDCFGVPSDPAAGTACDRATRAPAPAATLAVGKSDPLRIGSWEPAQSTPCPEDTADDEVCVPGGVFLLGDVRLAGSNDTATIERLVRIDPFAMDRDEMTVRRARELTTAAKVDPGSFDSGSLCTFRRLANPEWDDMPVNCLSFETAAALCTAAGKRLPTEAEWEYAAGGLGEERFVPWGDVTTACADAIVGRGRTLSEGADSDISTVCRLVDGEPLRAAGPAIGTTSRDVTPQGIRNLGGNLDEWALAGTKPYDDPCFGEGALLTNPHCPAQGAERPTRGGHWALPPRFAATAVRGINLKGGPSSFTGFRCVRPFGRP